MDRHTLEQLRSKVGGLLSFGAPASVRQAHGIMVENFENVVGFALDATEPQPKPKHTIADNYPAGGISSTEPCTFCEDYEKQQERIEELEKERSKLIEKYICSPCSSHRGCPTKAIDCVLVKAALGDGGKHG